MNNRLAYDAQFWVTHLEMEKHVEGGHYRETYRSQNQHAFPKFNGPRHYCTHIYFLLQQGEFSAFHRIRSDELWHFYYGDPLVIYDIDEQGEMKAHWLGQDISAGQVLQTVIPAGHWFASRPAPESAYALAGCTVAPGFDFRDFELADRVALSAQYPHLKQLIEELTH